MLFLTVAPPFILFLFCVKCNGSAAIYFARTLIRKTIECAQYHFYKFIPVSAKYCEQSAHAHKRVYIESVYNAGNLDSEMPVCSVFDLFPVKSNMRMSPGLNPDVTHWPAALYLFARTVQLPVL